MRKVDIYEYLVKTITDMSDEEGKLEANELLNIVETKFKPKRESLTRFAVYEDVANPLQVTHIICSISKYKLPATTVFFRQVKTGGIKVDADTMLSTKSILGSDIQRKHKEHTKNTATDIIAKMQKGELSIEEVKEQLEINSASKPDYSELAEYTN